MTIRFAPSVASHFAHRLHCVQALPDASLPPWNSRSFDTFDSLLEGFRQFACILFELKSCNFGLFGDSFFDSCLTISEKQPPESVDFTAEVILLGLKKCETFADHLRQSRLYEYLARFINRPPVIGIFSKLCSHSVQLNREIAGSEIFDAVLDLPPEFIQLQSKFCRHFLLACDPSDVSSFNRALRFLGSAFPASDRRTFRSITKGISKAIFLSRETTVGYLRQIGFFRRLCEAIQTAEAVETVQGCLEIVDKATRAYGLDLKETRALFPIGAILSCLRFNDESVNLGVGGVLTNLCGSAVWTLADFEDDAVSALIDRCLMQGNWRLRGTALRLIHNLVGTAEKENLSRVLAVDFLAEYFNIFVAMDGIRDPALYRTLPVLIELAKKASTFDFGPLVEYLKNVDGKGAICEVLLQGIEGDMD
jgi:hypothetical protein